MAKPSRQQGLRLVPLASESAAVMAQLLEEGTCTQHRNHPWSTRLWWQGGLVPLDTGPLVHKATLSRPGDVVDLPNTWKPAQRIRQSEETKKYVPDKRTRWNPRKELNKMEIPERMQGRVQRMLTKLGRRMDKHRENFNKVIKSDLLSFC